MDKTKQSRHSYLFNTDYVTSDLKGRSVRGGTITIISQGVKFIFKTGSTIVLARLLTPDDFGLIAMVLALTNFAMIYSNLGLSTATLQKKEINHYQISTMFWINFGFGLLITIIVMALAPVVAWFYDDPRLIPVTMALSVTFLFAGLAVQHQAMLQRHMQFFSIGIIEILSIVIGIAVAISAAFFDAGYWSLVYMHISMAASSAIGVWLFFPWKPGLPKKNVGVKKMLGFGGNITGFNIINYFARNMDNILIGKYIGSAALGFYSKAYGLLMLPLSQINAPVTSVVIPGLSRLYNDHQAYENYYLKAISLITFVTSPMIAYLVLMSEEIILLLLGNQWLEAAEIFSILGISAFIQPLYFTQGWLHMSAGKGRRYLYWGIIASSIIVLSFVLGLPYGVLGIATAYTVAMYILILPAMWYAGNSANIKVKKIFAAVWSNFSAAFLSAIVCFYALNFYITTVNQLLRLCLGFLLLGSLYLLFIIILQRGWKQLLDYAYLYKYIISKKIS